MSKELFHIIIATGLISLGSLIGVVTISINRRTLQRFLINLVSLSAGTLLGGAFLHLLPESVTELGVHSPFLIALLAFIGFFIIEKILRWRHCHHEVHSEQHTLGYMNLLGDFIHNIIDGIVIAGAFLTSPSLGVATTLAVALHEVPQEIGDFGVLLHSGFSRSKALILNLLVGLSAVLGGIIGYFLSSTIEGITPYMLPFAAGGFIYIAATDLVPEMNKATSLKRTASILLTFLAGISVMLLIHD